MSSMGKKQNAMYRSKSVEEMEFRAKYDTGRQRIEIGNVHCSVIELSLNQLRAQMCQCYETFKELIKVVEPEQVEKELA